MRALASEQLNPLIIPPDILWNILQELQNDIKTNARLKLSDDLVNNIWSYYGTTKLIPLVLENYLMLIPTVAFNWYIIADESVQSAQSALSTSYSSSPS